MKVGQRTHRLMTVPNVGRLVCTGRLICAASTLIFSTVLTANPNAREPNKAIASHGTIPGSAELVKALYDFYDSEEQRVIKLHDRTNNPARLPPQQIGDSYGKVWKARRDAERLKRMGEPAGHDLAPKLRLLIIAYANLAALSKGSPAGQKYYFAQKKKLVRETPKRNRFLAQAQSALEAGRLEIFQQTMEKYGVELHEKMSFLGVKERLPYSQAFLGLLSRGDSALQRKQRVAYAGAVKMAMEKNFIAAVEFGDEANRIRGQIASTGSADLGDGVIGDAAEAFAHVVQLWSNASAGLVRIASLRKVFRKGSFDPDGMGDSDGITETDATTPAAMKKLSQTALRELALLIAAAAESTPSDQVASTYAGLLKQISVVDRRLGGSLTIKSCESSLAKLAAKDPTLAVKVASYRQATSEVLVWRNRFASQQAERLVQKYPSTSFQMAQKSPLTKTNKPKIFGRLSTAPMVVAAPYISGPANWHVFESASRLVGKPVSDGPTIRLTPKSRTAIVPYRNYHYANVPLPIPAEDELADLKRVLLVDEAHPAISIAAADAISSAELHEYEQIGGVVSNLHLEAFVTRFISLPDVAGVLVPLGRLPLWGENDSPMTRACWRFDVIPHWARHKYFVVQIPLTTQ